MQNIYYVFVNFITSESNINFNFNQRTLNIIKCDIYILIRNQILFEYILIINYKLVLLFKNKNFNYLFIVSQIININYTLNLLFSN